MAHEGGVVKRYRGQTKAKSGPFFVDDEGDKNLKS